MSANVVSGNPGSEHLLISALHEESLSLDHCRSLSDQWAGFILLAQPPLCLNQVYLNNSLHS